MSLLQPSKKTIQVLTYVGVLLCATMLVVGALAAIFETAVIVRTYGGLTAVAALIVGTVISRPLWPDTAALPASPMPPNSTE